MGDSRWVALLRGINVGGKNVIPMAALRAAFERAGFGDVTTYIQSGNVLFRAPSASKRTKSALTATIERALSESFAYESRVVLLSDAELACIVDEAPPNFGAQPDRYRYDVLFVKPPTKPNAVLEAVTTKPGVDDVHLGAHALYFRRLVAKASQSHLAKIAQRPIYRSLTIRNWNTTRKLSELVRSAVSLSTATKR